MHIQRDLIIEARDGIKLRADLYLPDGDGPFPTLYAASPYRKDLVDLPVSTAFRFRETGPIEWWTQQGYAYLLADLRGTGMSEGQFGLWSRETQEDLYDTIEWIAEQAWSSGKISMAGESGYGITHWLAAVQRPPHLTCVLSYNAGTDFYRDAVYHGGIFSGGFFQFWTLDNLRASALVGELIPPNPNALNEDMLGNVLAHPRIDEYWEERSAFRRLDQVDVPTFVIGFWSNVGLHLRGYDIEVWPTCYRFTKGSRIRVEIAPGDSQIADGLFWHYYGHKVGTDTIYHDSEHPSHLLLPVVPTGE